MDQLNHRNIGQNLHLECQPLHAIDLLLFLLLPLTKKSVDLVELEDGFTVVADLYVADCLQGVQNGVGNGVGLVVLRLLEVLLGFDVFMPKIALPPFSQFLQLRHRYIINQLIIQYYFSKDWQIFILGE